MAHSRFKFVLRKHELLQCIKYENSNNINTTYNIIVTDWLGLTLCTSCVYIF